jgi:endonuclease/exonuclease/phosphatase family metal-dependent hydrolase
MPKSLFRRITKRFVVIVNIIVAVVFLLACLAPYLNPTRWWIIGFLGLGFPFILLTLLLFLFFWLIVKPRYIIVSLVAMLIGWQSINAFFAFNKPTDFKQPKSTSQLRVMTWNVARFVEMRRNNNRGSMTRLKMMDLIKQENPDVLCLQEFFHSDNPDWYQNITHIQQELNYPYFYFSREVDGHLHYNGSVIFSRLPMADSGMVIYPRPSLPEALIYADVVFNNDTIRIFTTHLQSVQFNKKDHENIDNINAKGDSTFEASRNILYKLKRGLAYRSIQTDVVKTEMARSPHKNILCGDFNDVPNSYTYFQLKGNMQDVFLKKGFGLGRTYISISPTLRIDYIFADRQFKVEQFKKIDKILSDHYPLVTDLSVQAAQ